MNYPYENFYEMLSFSVSRKPAIFIGNYKLTYERLLKKVDTLARFLELSDIKKGDRVAIFMQNTKEFAISLFAITKIGAVAVPINTFLKEEEVAYILNDCDAKILMASSQLKNVVEPLLGKTQIKRIVWEGDYELLDNKNIGFSEIFEILKSYETVELPKIDDLAIIIYTSGTTGNPKGAMLSYRNIFHNCQAIGELTKFTQKDRFIVYLPMLRLAVYMPFLVLACIGRPSLRASNSMSK